MAFSSTFFLFAFLPAVAACYFGSGYFGSGYFSGGPTRRNAVLLAASLLFYTFDAGWQVWILLVSIGLNHAAARLLPELRGARRRVVFVAAIAVNLALLFHYKYTGFLWTAAAAALAPAGVALGPAPVIALPIGISFFTFQAISYLADVNRGIVPPARRLVDFAMYHALFPQLIAGPIVRYVEVAAAVHARRETWDDAADGIFRFCLGLGKKLILADPLGGVTDRVFALPPNELDAAVAWTGIACYMLQIYYDFSGYSDMAIGLGRLFGFSFPENFNQPYRARSITEFWRRWHMTLSRWFRDYVYIPLGGNRRGRLRTYRNLVVVFFLCGLWHGAGFTFVLWGLYHGALLVGERVWRTLTRLRLPGWLSWPATLLLVAIGWVVFRAPTLADAGHYLAVMFGLSEPAVVYYPLAAYLTPHVTVLFVVGIGFALLPFERLALRLDGPPPVFCAKAATAFAVFGYAVLQLADHSFSPFIYFRF